MRRSGENIGVLEVESALYMDTRIGGCAVTPVPDDIRGEEVFAFIVPKAEIDDADALAASIVKTCAERLAYHKVPGYIAIVDELPLVVNAQARPRRDQDTRGRGRQRQTRDRHARAEGEAAPRLSPLRQ